MHMYKDTDYTTNGYNECLSLKCDKPSQIFQ